MIFGYLSLDMNVKVICFKIYIIILIKVVILKIYKFEELYFCFILCY